MCIRDSTIDVVKYDSNDTLHLSTAALAGAYMPIFATEQMDVPGVSMPWYLLGQLNSWGMVEGTRIGYIYSLGWMTPDDEADWYNAIDSLMHGRETDGLIIDFRTNYGGNPSFMMPGLGLLFDEVVDEMRIFWRADPDDHFAMEPSPLLPSTFMMLLPDPETYYDKPIALLTGPGCMSCGDIASFLLSFHPMVKIFGKPTTAAFNSPERVGSVPEFYFCFSRNETRLIRDTSRYLTHSEFPNEDEFPWAAYEEVWLTPDMVAAGRDDVVEAAVAWITSDMDEDGVFDYADNCPEDFNPDQEDADGNGVGDACQQAVGAAIVEGPGYPHRFVLHQNYPNPFNAHTVIGYELPSRSSVRASIYNVLGRRIAVVLDGVRGAGRHQLAWDGRDQSGEMVAGGVYFCIMQAGLRTASIKMLLLK